MGIFYHNGIRYGGTSNVPISVTRAQYEALSDKDKNADVIYIITDEDSGFDIDVATKDDIAHGLSSKVDTTDVLTFEEIMASTDLTGKIASADAIKQLDQSKGVYYGNLDECFTPGTYWTMSDFVQGALPKSTDVFPQYWFYFRVYKSNDTGYVQIANIYGYPHDIVRVYVNGEWGDWVDGYGQLTQSLSNHSHTFIESQSNGVTYRVQNDAGVLNLWKYENNAWSVADSYTSTQSLANNATLLWSNPNPSSEMGEMTITVPNMDKYKYVVFLAKGHTSYANNVASIISKTPSTFNWTSVDWLEFSVSRKVWSRSINRVGATSISIKDAYNFTIGGTGYAVENARMIITEIYGTNIL